jgi:hypothetical protein
VLTRRERGEHHVELLAEKVLSDGLIGSRGSVVFKDVSQGIANLLVNGSVQ